MEVYQLDEVSAMLGLLRRQARSYLDGELIEQYLVELDQLCPDIYSEETAVAPT